MSFSKVLCKTLTAALALACQFVFAADSVEFSNVSWDFQDNGGGGKAVVSKTEVEHGGKKEQGLRIVLSKCKSKYKKDTLTVSFKPEKPVNMHSEYPVLDFTIRTPERPGAFISMNYFNANGAKQRHDLNWTKPLNESIPQLRKFHYDLQRQPCWVWIGDTDGVNEVRFVFDLNKLPSPEVTVEFSKLRAVAEDIWAKTPDRNKKWKEWLKWVNSWEPDFSDSSKYLLPPEKGRIAKPLSLTINGKANAEIVINDDPDKIVSTAAAELQYWLSKISGAKLPVVTAPGPLPVKIFLNPANGKELFAKDLEYLKPDGKIYSGDDGFYVRTKGNNIYIGGLVPKGTMNGVFRFLENNTDIIWHDYNPNYGTVYSENKNVKAVWADDVLKPRSKYRGTMGGDILYKARNLGYERSSVNRQYGSGFFNDGLLESYLDHDEFYALNGDPDKGYVRNRVMYYNAQACLREEAFEHTRDEILEKIKKDREKGNYYTVINCGVEDNWNVCCCEECTQPITLPDGTVLTSNKRSEKHAMPDPKEKRYRSNQYWMFINRLAEAVREVYPEMYIGALDYFYAEVPPDIPTEPNIYHIYCPLYPSRTDFRNPIFSPSNPTVWDYTNKWSKKEGFFDMYEYFYDFPSAETAKWDFIQYMELGWKGFGWEHAMDKAGGLLGLAQSQDYWSMYRLMWDPYKYDVQQLRKYYIRRVYHEGAPVIEKLQLTAVKKVFSGVYANHTPSWPYHAVIKEQGEELLKMFKEYLPKIKNPMARINFGRMMMLVEDIYKAQQDAKAGIKLDGKARNFNKVAGLLTNVFYGNWGENFNHEYGIADTLIEEDGKFKRAVRLVFPNDKKYKRKFQFTASNSIPQQKDKVMLPGFIRFKIKAVVPGKTARELPYFSISTKLGDEFSQPKRDYKTDAMGITRVKFSPDGTGISLDDLKGFGLRFDKSQLDNRKPYAEFLFYDFEICKETLGGDSEEDGGGSGKPEDIEDALDEFLE